EVLTFNSGAKVTRNSRVYTDASGQEHTISCGLPIYVTNPVSYKYEDGSGRSNAKKGEACAVFYVPQEVLDTLGISRAD
ncbi:MAG: hypothetical protein J6112_01410, partial [Clostridia bacterium]|nr:hypothetical protein [Clostridia bacterium]